MKKTSNTKKKHSRSKQIVKTLQENDDGELYIEFTEEELNFRDDIGKEIQQTHNQPVSHHYKIEDSLFTKEEEERIRIYEERN